MSIIKINEGIARHPLHRMKNPINFSLEAGEHLAIVGPNGGGKSELVNTIIGKYPLLMNDVEYDFSPRTSHMAYDNIRYMAFRDTYGDTAEGSYYYQQRWKRAIGDGRISFRKIRIGKDKKRYTDGTGKTDEHR